MDLRMSPDVFAEPDHDRLVRRLKRLTGADLDDQEVSKLADGDLTLVPELTVPAQLGVMALLKPDDDAVGVLEKVVGTSIDYVGIAFLDRARAAGRSVVRVVGPDRAPIGTGVMVSPRLVLTNHHVTEDQAQAAAQLVQFDYELAADGTPTPTVEFRLDPNAFFHSSPVDELDFSLVAVGARAGGARELASFGFLPLSSAGDKHAEGDFVTIVEHPEGLYKQIALRENRVIGRGRSGRTLHYGADTLGGSSGSPVFNDQFEVVALHHAGGPRNERFLDTGKKVPAASNEGIRISAIVGELVEHLKTLAGTTRDVLAAALDPPQRGPTPVGPTPEAAGAATRVASAGGSAEVLVPLVLDVRLGTVGIDSPNVATSPREQPAVSTPTGLELNRPPDPKYANRRGYSLHFLGRAHEVPLPALGDEVAGLAAETKTGANELHYLHFSSVQNRVRRLPLFTAVNIDGARAPKNVVRKTGDIVWGSDLEASDAWYSDPRLAEDQQLTGSFYERQTFRMFDRGHMVRRLDPAWGAKATILRAVDDTFHFTNCAPQAWQFNEQARYWAGIEDYVLENAKAAKSRITVFTGPFFADDDPLFWNVPVPQAFWKILVRVDPELGLRATAFIADQTKFLRAGLDKLEAFTGDWDDVTKVRDYQAAIADIAKRAHLDFGKLAEHDTYAPTEALERIELRSFGDIQL